jgi:hypothetical protein
LIAPDLHVNDSCSPFCAPTVKVLPSGGMGDDCALDSHLEREDFAPARVSSQALAATGPARCIPPICRRQNPWRTQPRRRWGRPMRSSSMRPSRLFIPLWPMTHPLYRENLSGHRRNSAGPSLFFLGPKAFDRPYVLLPDGSSPGERYFLGPNVGVETTALHPRAGRSNI